MDQIEWEARVDAFWAAASGLEPAELVSTMDALIDERGIDDARAAYEAGSARDSAGFEADAVAHYQRALDEGLEEPYRSQLVIQHASTLRNLGEYDRALALLDLIPEDHELAESAVAFRSLVLASKGEWSRALTLALTTLAPHLPRYQRAVAAYAGELPAH